MAASADLPAHKLASRGAAVVGRIDSRPFTMVPLAIAVGVITGFGGVFFRWLITCFTRIFTGYDDYSGLGRVASTHWPALGIWFLLFTPVIAGALYGPLVSRFAPEARGVGVPEVIYAETEGGGRIRPRVTVVKAFASALCIGGGGSVGREGPIIQIGAGVGSAIAQLARLDTGSVRLLVAGGVAGGISATFNAPLAGPIFAMEVILRNVTGRAFGVPALASVAATAIGRVFFGNAPFFDLPAFTVKRPVEYLLYALLGLTVGAVGVGFSKLLYFVGDICDWAWRGPQWARPAVGGVLLGGVLLALPEMYGVGYPVLKNAVLGHYALAMLLVLMLGKMFATSLTIGIGGSGGIFAPSLFIGAMAGAGFGTAINYVFDAEQPGMYALVGMAAALAGATRAPVTAVIIIFELTGEYTLVLALMTAVAIATGVSRLISRDTIYSQKLLRRGLDIEHRAVDPL